MSSMIKKFIFKEPQGDGEFVEIEISDEWKDSETIRMVVDGMDAFSISFETAKELSAVLQGLVGTVPVKPLKPHQLPRGTDGWNSIQPRVHDIDDENPTGKDNKSPIEVLNSYLNNG